LRNKTFSVFSARALAVGTMRFFRVSHIASDTLANAFSRHRPERQKSADPVEHTHTHTHTHTHGLIVIYEPRYKVLSNATFTVAYTVVKFLPSVLRKVPTDRETTKHDVSRCAPALTVEINGSPPIRHNRSYHTNCAW